MNIVELEHAIRSACVVSGDTEVYVFGSQAILGSYPDAPAALLRSPEADVQPKNRPEATDLVDGALGEGSPFHAEYSFWVHGIEFCPALFPTGWEGRTVAVCDPVGTLGNTGYCLDAHDLAANKLAVGRDKDLRFVETLLTAGLISPATLKERVKAIPPGQEGKVDIALRYLSAWARSQELKEGIL